MRPPRAIFVAFGAPASAEQEVQGAARASFGGQSGFAAQCCTALGQHDMCDGFFRQVLEGLHFIAQGTGSSGGRKSASVAPSELAQSPAPSPTWRWVKTNHFGVGALPILVYLSGDWDVHWGYGILTHGQMCFQVAERPCGPCLEHMRCPAGRMRSGVAMCGLSA